MPQVYQSGDKLPTVGSPEYTAAQASGTTSSNPSTGNDSFLSALTSRLMGQSDIVSSQDTNVESAISGAISSLNAGNAAADARTTSAFDREISYAKTGQTDTLAENQNNQRGYATNVAALRSLVDSTDKQVNDLETRKQEALLANDSATASKISDLQIQALGFKQKAQQDTFNNLLSLGSFALQGKQQADQVTQFNKTISLQEKSAVSEIALKFGIPVKEGDTIDTIAARAAPFASAAQKLELQKTQSEINRNNAEAKKALSGDGSTSLDPNVIAMLAQAGNANPAVLGLIKDPKQAAAVILSMQKMNEPRAFSATELGTLVSTYKSQGQSATAIKAAIAKDAKITNKDEAYSIVDSTFGGSDSKSSLYKDLSNFGAGLLNNEGSLAEYLTGQKPNKFSYIK